MLPKLALDLQSSCLGLLSNWDPSKRPCTRPQNLNMSHISACVFLSLGPFQVPLPHSSVK